jgi:ribosomal protein L21E
MKTFDSLRECKDEVDFKPHMMYNPKTGEGVKANTYADHVRLDKKGYTHEKPVEEGAGLEEATVPRKDFEELKKGDKVTVNFDSSMKKGHKEKLVVKSKSRSNKYNVDKVTMGSATDSRNRTKFILYSRGGKDATLAWGDMGVVLTKFVKEETQLMKTFEQIREKTLTPAEKKKREEIAKAMEKDNPDMPMDKKMAIATAQAKKVAEAKAPQLGKKGMVRAKDGKNYKVQMIQSGNKIEFKITSEFGDFKTITVGQLARMYK